MSTVRLEVVVTVDLPVKPDEPPQVALTRVLEFGAQHPQFVVIHSRLRLITGKILGDGPTSWLKHQVRHFADAIELAKKKF